MEPWRVKFHKILEDKSLTPDTIYNGDQTGLLYQKLPNRLYVDSKQKGLCWCQTNEGQDPRYSYDLHRC